MSALALVYYFSSPSYMSYFYEYMYLKEKKFFYLFIFCSQHFVQQDCSGKDELHGSCIVTMLIAVQRLM